MTSSFCSLPRVAGRFLLRKIAKLNTKAFSNYVCLGKYSEKLENICGGVYFVKVVGLQTTAYLK